MIILHLAAALAGGVVIFVLARAMLSRGLERYWVPGAGSVEAAIAAAIGPRASFRRFLRLSSAGAALAILLTAVAFAASLPPILSALADHGEILPLTTRFLPASFMTVLSIQYLAWTSTGLATPQLARLSARGLALALVADIALRLILFALVSMLVFSAYAHFAGSFGGSVANAVSVVPATMASAARFDNLTGITFYAALSGGYPLMLALAARTGPVVTAAARVALALGLAGAALAYAASLSTFPPIETAKGEWG